MFRFKAAKKRAFYAPFMHAPKKVPKPSPKHSAATPAWEEKQKAILHALGEDPNASAPALAKRFNVHHSTVYKLKERLSAANGEEDRATKWGRLLSRAVPLALRARTMRDLVKSNNPVAAARALEMVLESDGLRKKASEPKRESVIVVQAGDDVTFE